MKRRSVVATAALAVAIAVPAIAGSGAGKCTQTTQACLDSYSKYASKGWVGLEYDKSAGEKSYTIKRAVPGSPAEAAGFKPGDVLVSLNGVAMTAEKETLKKAKGEWAVGQTIAYVVKRGDQQVRLNAKLAEMPAEVFASMVGEHMVSNHMSVATSAIVK
jgi:predicted metalloprotease with PDZ domain